MPSWIEKQCRYVSIRKINDNMAIQTCVEMITILIEKNEPFHIEFCCSNTHRIAVLARCLTRNRQYCSNRSFRDLCIRDGQDCFEDVTFLSNLEFGICKIGLRVQMTLTHYDFIIREDSSVQKRTILTPLEFVHLCIQFNFDMADIGKIYWIKQATRLEKLIVYINFAYNLDEPEFTNFIELVKYRDCYYLKNYLFENEKNLFERDYVSIARFVTDNSLNGKGGATRILFRRISHRLDKELTNSSWKPKINIVMSDVNCNDLIPTSSHRYVVPITSSLSDQDPELELAIQASLEQYELEQEYKSINSNEQELLSSLTLVHHKEIAMSQGLITFNEHQGHLETVIGNIARNCKHYPCKKLHLEGDLFTVRYDYGDLRLFTNNNNQSISDSVPIKLIAYYLRQNESEMDRILNRCVHRGDIIVQMVQDWPEYLNDSKFVEKWILSDKSLPGKICLTQNRSENTFLVNDVIIKISSDGVQTITTISTFVADLMQRNDSKREMKSYKYFYVFPSHEIQVTIDQENNIHTGAEIHDYAIELEQLIIACRWNWQQQLVYCRDRSKDTFLVSLDLVMARINTVELFVKLDIDLNILFEIDPLFANTFPLQYKLEFYDDDDEMDMKDFENKRRVLAEILTADYCF